MDVRKDEPLSASQPQLRRVLTLPGAVMMGLGSIVGTGVFVSIGVAAGVSGPAVILAIVIAAFVALCNALSSAQLAASHAVSGGTYEYGYTCLNPALGFIAGWTFLLAKTASAATAALGFAGYLLNVARIDQAGVRTIVAIVVAAVTMLVRSGVRRSNVANSIIVSITLCSLLLFSIAGLPHALERGTENLWPFFGTADTVAEACRALLHGCALMFVAFTGYGRIATLGEEVRDPQRNIPRAIIITLIVSALLYIAVACVAVATFSPQSLASVTRQQAAPLERVAQTFDVPVVAPIVAIGAVTAMLGVLLNLVLGLSRVLLAMGRRGDMPRFFARISADQATPGPAVIAVGIAIIALAALGDVRLTWSFSAFTVLIYYAITNAAALRLPRQHRRYPRAFAWMGLASCLFLAFWIDWPVWLTGLTIIALGLMWHAFRRKYRRDVE